MTVPDTDFTGRRVLVVEDEYLTVDLLVEILEDKGIEVIGPASSVEKALALIAETPRIDAALVDVNLRGRMSFPIADALQARAVRFAFTTGYDDGAVPSRYAAVACYQKPIDPMEVVAKLLA